MNITIVIPTYNEAPNIEPLVSKLSAVFKDNPEDTYSVLFVDGNSPDGTGNVIKQMQQVHDNIHLLVETEKSGLGKAYIKGFKYALSNLNPDVVMEMDADLQHNPLDVPRIVAPIKNGADYVIGSRFINGGSIPRHWALYRKFLSVFGNIFIRVVLGIFNVHDFTSGFRATRVKGLLDSLNLDNLSTGGFAYKLDLLYQMHLKGASIVEVPIHFGVRTSGTSKMPPSTVYDSLRIVLLLRAHKSRKFLKFLIAGFVGLFVDTSLFNIFLWTKVLPPRYSAFASGSIAMIVTFLINNNLAFKEHKIDIRNIEHVLKSFAVYAGSSYIPIFVRSALVAFFVNKWGASGIISNIGFFLGILFGLIWNFTVYSKIIWRKKLNE